MQNKSLALSLLAVASTFGACITGCGGNTSSDSGTTAASAATENGSQATASSTKPESQQDRTAAPKQTVALFLDSLRRGDEVTANSMLTSKARAELEKTAWVMQPLGTPEGQYNIGRIEFPYPDQALALVECRWIEPATESEPELVMDVVCETYQESDGWRIAGLAVTVADEPEPLVIDFEDGARLQQMLDMANESVPATSSSQVAQPGSAGTPPTDGGLPAFPDFPAGSQSSQEVAMPPEMRNVLR